MRALAICLHLHPANVGIVLLYRDYTVLLINKGISLHAYSYSAVKYCKAIIQSKTIPYIGTMHNGKVMLDHF